MGLHARAVPPRLPRVRRLRACASSRTLFATSTYWIQLSKLVKDTTRANVEQAIHRDLVKGNMEQIRKDELEENEDESEELEVK